MDNIIKFPNNENGIDNFNSPEDLSSTIEKYKEDFVGEFSEILGKFILAELERVGAKMNPIEDYYPSIVLVIEAIQALHLKTFDIDHPLQQLALEMFEDVEFNPEKLVDNDDFLE
jgi:hypothetical protein